MNNLFHSGRILGIALLSAAVPLCMAANHQNNFDADRMDRHWKSTDSNSFARAAVATGELEQAWRHRPRRPTRSTATGSAAMPTGGSAYRPSWTRGAMNSVRLQRA